MIEAGPATLEVDAARGARLASLTLWGTEVLITGHADSIRWGCYPMVPWAGRIRHGRFSFDGVDYQLPHNLGDHAIHGTVFEADWEGAEDRWIVELTEPWPFPGRVVQRAELAPDSLRMELELHADAPMPASMGWHPWFRRWIDDVPFQLEIEAQWMEKRDASGIQAGERVLRPFQGVGDDCLGGVTQPVMLKWPGILELELRSDCDYWVVYVNDSHGIAVEPQTHPPNALNIEPAIVEPGRPLTTWMEWKWRQLA